MIASLFNLAGPDLFAILILVALCFAGFFRIWMLVDCAAYEWEQKTRIIWLLIILLIPIGDFVYLFARRPHHRETGFAQREAAPMPAPARAIRVRNPVFRTAEERKYMWILASILAAGGALLFTQVFLNLMGMATK